MSASRQHSDATGSDRLTSSGGRRVGLSLLEVVLAVAILTGALAAIGHQASVGINAALRSELSTEAALRCQAQLELLQAGGLRRLPVTDQVLPGRNDWRWSAELLPSDFEGLQLLRVSVHRVGGRQERWSRWTLVRLVRAPEKIPGVRQTSTVRETSSETRKSR